MKNLKEDAVARLGIAILILMGLSIGLMTFLLLIQEQVLGVISVVVSTSLPGGPLYGKPLMTFIAIYFSIKIFSGTNALILIGTALNDLFFGMYWWMNYGINYIIIGYFIQFLGSL
mgnify:CR=1 FL=1